MNREITPELVLRAYTIGVFPMAESRTGDIFWCDPERRGILEFQLLKVSKSLGKTIKSEQFTVTYNKAFPEVIRICADRDPTWISDQIEELYCTLHDRGFAHSVEVWDGQMLAGGLYGVALNGVFFGESMFHTIRDCSKIAFVHLVRHLELRGFSLLDMQYLTSHLESLGAIEIAREEYLRRLDSALQVQVSFHDREMPTGVLPIAQSLPMNSV